MKHLFLNRELSLIAKEKGFDEPCFAYFSLSHTSDDYNFHIVGEYTHYRDLYLNYVGAGLRNSDLEANPTGRLHKCMTAPLYQQITEWLKSKGVLVCERWDGWEYGSNAWDEFIYCKDRDTAIEEAFKLV